jgi:signal transduction histidine kinase
MADPRQGPLVLYVDDERANRVVFEQSLGAELPIRVVADAATALDVLAKDEVSVVVTDMRMPTMNGEELLRIVKERHPQVIRMVVTAYSDIDPILRAINEGLVARYIIKPWVRAELLQVLRWAVEAYAFGRDSAALHHRLLETERLASLGGMVGMMVHDLKQPLMSLLVNVEHLQELAAAAPTLRYAIEQIPLDHQQRDRLLELIEDLPPVLEDVQASTKHLGELITGLRDFTRPRDPKAPLATDPLPVVRHAMAVCQKLSIGTSALIGYQGPTILPAVRMSATELTQILINIVANGAQAVAARGQAHGSVSISARTDDGMLELAVHDDGIGMPPDVLKRVGTPFFTTRSEGTGLGLAQCQRLVGTAGGRMRIESEQGKGTTVTILLPLAA